MKKQYSKPEIEVININEKDIILTSLEMGPSQSHDNIVDMATDF